MKKVCLCLAFVLAAVCILCSCSDLPAPSTSETVDPSVDVTLKKWEDCGASIDKAEEISGYVNGKEERLIAQDAWEVVRKKASQVGYEKGLDELEGITRLAAKTVWRFFDPRNSQSYNESAAMSQFCKAYEQLAAREQRNMEIAESIKSNGLLMEARKRAELNMPQKTEIKMLDNGHLVEVEKFDAVDLKSMVKDADISEEGKKLIMGVLE